ncbi:hypothetical protein C2G38_2217654 [Gigaspora rosea]|uniref:Uncharacterized protein n=1 Tax=Gigaspora rosea TaxID=44941 RepID=A0A397UAU7_9GLOM|nr:hypothetical protein C2G38_2217654 [Gigaspora rosea]
MTPQEEIQKISALEAKYKNPSGLPIISKPKVSKDKKQTKISLSKVFSLNETKISEVKKMAAIILDNYRILHDTTISRVKPTLALMKDEKKKQKVQEKMPNENIANQNNSDVEEIISESENEIENEIENANEIENENEFKQIKCKITCYIARGQVAKDSSFYASLRPGFTSQEYSPRSKASNRILETILKESVGPNERIDNCSVEQIEEIKDSDLDIFLEEIKNDYQNAGSQYRTALDEFIERYRTSKSFSIPRLTSFLYNSNRNIDLPQVKSGAMIRTQVESVKRRKLEGTSGTRRLRNISNKVKENLDPQTIPCRKKRKVNKREHSLGKNIAKNQLN